MLYIHIESEVIMKITRIFDILYYRKATDPNAPLFFWKGLRKWQATDTGEYFRMSRQLGMAALKTGFRKGETFATLCHSYRPEWNIVDMGLMQTGMIHVPVHPGTNPETLRLILEQANVKVLFIQGRNEWEEYQKTLTAVRSVKAIYSFSRVPEVSYWKDLVGEIKPFTERDERILETAMQLVQPSDPATIVYTSGTYGRPKGVVLSHLNLVSNVLGSANLQPLGPGDRVLSFLPLSHIYERTSNYVFQYRGVQIYYAQNYLHVKDHLLEVAPHGITAVPRFLEKIEDSVILESERQKGVGGVLFRKALKIHVYYRADHYNTLKFRLIRKIYDLLVYRKIRKKLGGNLRFIGCGGAPLSLLTEKFFWTLGLPVYQGYGLTETSPLVTLNRKPREDNHLGTAGPVIPGAKIRLADDREIEVRSPGVMKYYFKDPQATREAFTPDGWFKTGDIGRLIQGKYLKITGRKKEMFKTSYGNYIVPALIEGKLRRSLLIANALVYGEGEKFPAALIQPDFKEVRLWLRQHIASLPLDRETLIRHPLVQKKIFQEIEKVNKTMDQHEQIRSFHIIPDQWSVASGDLSASYKLRRPHLMNRYRYLIEKTYAG